MGTFLGRNGFSCWLGVVENRMDPLNLGRCQVRMYGKHPINRSELPTTDLPWAIPSISVDSATFMTSLKEGDWVHGFFLDDDFQKPVIQGFLPGFNPKDAPDPEIGFCDGRTNLDAVPLPPEQRPPEQKPAGISITRFKKIIEDLGAPPEISTALNRVIDLGFNGETSVDVGQIPTEWTNNIQKAVDKLKSGSGGGTGTDNPISSSLEAIENAFGWLLKNIQSIISKLSLDYLLNEGSELLDKFSSKDVLPGSSTGFGVLMKNFDISYFDINKDGKITADDAKAFIEQCLNKTGFFTGDVSNIIATVPPSPNPHPDKRGKPTINSIAFGDTSNPIVQRKNSDLATIECAGHPAEDESAQSEGMSVMQPPSPYAPVAPYNKATVTESGNCEEKDDTPGHERLCWYHRAGTFTEIGPDGTEVNKIVAAQYNIIKHDYFLKSEKSINVEAKDAIRMKAGSDFNRSVGGNLNATVGDNYHLGVGKGVYIYAKDGVVYIKANGNVSIESSGDDGVVEIKATKKVVLSGPEVYIQGPGGAEATINLVSSDVKVNKLVAHTAQSLSSPPPPAEGVEGVENDAEKKSKTSESMKDGWLWPFGLYEELWKPESDSNKKLVTLSESPVPHEIYEAIPTAPIQGILLKYMRPDGGVQDYEIARWTHVPGRLIDTPVMMDKFEDGKRFMWRWSKPGGAYPKVCFLKTGSGYHFIIDSSQRHWFKFAFNEVLPFTPAGA